MDTLFVSNSQVIGCEDRLRNDLYYVGWSGKLYSVNLWILCPNILNTDTVYVVRVCLSVRLSVTFSCRDQMRWNTSRKIISRLISD